jgi:hypothetical protein
MALDIGRRFSPGEYTLNGVENSTTKNSAILPD